MSVIDRPKPKIYKLSVPKYEQMIEAGILTEDDRVELIRGEIVEKMAIGDAHVRIVNNLNRLLSRRLDDAYLASIQNPVVLSDSEPEPDVAVIPANLPRKPLAEDVRLIIEVSDSSLNFDRAFKLPIYAEADIGDVWLVDAVGETIEVYRQPQREGTYRIVQTVRRGDEIALLAFPDLRLAVDEIFGARS